MILVWSSVVALSNGIREFGFAWLMTMIQLRTQKTAIYSSIERTVLGLEEPYTPVTDAFCKVYPS